MTPEERLEMYTQQAFAKIRWGSEEDEVRDWLIHEKFLLPLEAGHIVKRALRARAMAIRFRAIVMLIVSGLGLAAAIGYFAFQAYVGVYYVGARSAGVLVLGGISLVAFLRNLFRLLTGKTTGPVDEP